MPPRTSTPAHRPARHSAFARLALVNVTLEPREVNGQPGAILRDQDGKVLSTLILDILGGQVQTIRSVSNPDKLGFHRVQEKRAG